MGRQLQFISAGTVGGEEVVAMARDPHADPERRMASAEILDRVETALHQLPEHYRVVVWLRDGENLSYQEIADTLDLPIGTVRSRLARARDNLRRIVER
jgi:RNA polymerase sigma-70 factor (ECF subfamily)